MMAGERELPAVLHVIPGLSAAGSFRQAFGRDVDILVHEDILSFGPTPRCTDAGEWVSIRNEFLGLGEFRSAAELSRNPGRLAAASSLWIWAGAGVEDQLFVGLVIDLARNAGRALDGVRLVQFEQRPSSRGLVVGLGELGPSQLAAYPEPRMLDGALLRDYETLWTALTADSPHELYLFAGRHPDANPFVRQAATLMRRRYPGAASGLPYWDFELLRQTRGFGPRATRVIASTMTHEEPRGLDWVGDLYLYEQMHLLADPESKRPLLTLKEFGASMRDNEVRLTEFGNAVLDGEAAYFPANDIDYWVGGSHLSSAEGRLWFDDGKKLIPG